MADHPEELAAARAHYASVTGVPVESVQVFTSRRPDWRGRLRLRRA